MTVTASAELALAQRAILLDRGWAVFVGTQFPNPGR
jgi:hypothetical protein